MSAPMNRATLAPGHDPAHTYTYIYVNDKRISIAALLAMNALAATWVNARGCTGLTALDLPAATTVYASGCTGLTALTLPAATTVYASGCTGLTALDLPAATWVDARGVDCSPCVIQGGTDARGYDFVGVRLSTGWRVFAGCRNKSFDEAVAHWSRPGAAPGCLALVERIIVEAARRDGAAA